MDFAEVVRRRHMVRRFTGEPVPAESLDRYAQPDKGWTDRDERRWPVPFWHIDTGMAALLILLTVVDEGLGALYFGIMPEAVEPFREAFGVPDDHEPIGAIDIGYDGGAA